MTRASVHETRVCQATALGLEQGGAQHPGPQHGRVHSAANGNDFAGRFRRELRLAQLGRLNRVVDLLCFPRGSTSGPRCRRPDERSDLGFAVLSAVVFGPHHCSPGLLEKFHIYYNQYRNMQSSNQLL